MSFLNILLFISVSANIILFAAVHYIRDEACWYRIRFIRASDKNVELEHMLVNMIMEEEGKL